MLRTVTLWACFLFGAGALIILIAVVSAGVYHRRNDRRAMAEGYDAVPDDDDTFTWVAQTLHADIVVKPEMVKAGPVPDADEEDVHWSPYYGEIHAGPARFCRYCEPDGEPPRYEDLTDTDILQRVTPDPWVVGFWGMDATALTDALFEAACRPALPG